MTKYQTMIGRAELIEFPAYLLGSVPAKTDTGAYRSAIHATNIKLKTSGGQQVVAFDLLEGHPAYRYSRHIEMAEFQEVQVENSFGIAQTRYAVKFRVKLAGKVFNSEFTLADRSKKTYPILLGRKLLSKRFIVDTAKSNINRVELKKKMNIDLEEDLEVIDP